MSTFQNVTAYCRRNPKRRLVQGLGNFALTFPVCGSYIFWSNFISALLPQPLSPNSATVCPSSTVTFIDFKICESRIAINQYIVPCKLKDDTSLGSIHKSLLEEGGLMRNCPVFKMTHTCFIKTFSDSLLVSENLRLSNPTLLRITALTVLEFRYPTWGHLYVTPLFTSFFWRPRIFLSVPPTNFCDCSLIEEEYKKCLHASWTFMPFLIPDVRAEKDNGSKH